MLDLSKPKEVNEVFCKTIGIKPLAGVIINLDTNEVRYYQCPTSLYRKPVGWSNIKTICFKEPMYPNFLDPYNFIMLMEVQWLVFGCIDNQYKRIKNESFPVNYLYSKIKAIETLRNYGGSEMMDIYIDMIKDIRFTIEVPINDDTSRCNN